MSADIAGAALKNGYLAAIQSAGFHEVKVLAEDVYPIELMTADPIAQSICADLNLSGGQARGLSKSVASVKVVATKPG